ncbi:MAG: carbohydrate ABC transporter permease [Aggregatilineales bacterium]
MATYTESQGLAREPSLFDSFKKGLKTSGVPWLFVAPAIIIMIFITFLPQLFQIYVAFRDFGVQHLTGVVPAPYVGLDNFVKVLTDGLNVPNYNFFPLLGFNIFWTFANVALHVIIGLAVALALNTEGLIGRPVYRVLYVIPWALPGYISALIWNNLWQQNGGGINLLLAEMNRWFGTSIRTNTPWLTSIQYAIDLRGLVPWLIIVGGGAVTVWLVLRLRRLGLRNARTGLLDTSRVVWSVGLIILLGLSAVFTLLDVLRDGASASNAVIQLFDRAGAPVLAFYAVLAANVWLGWPFMMVVATGALQSIPKDLYEAADVDGATRIQRLRFITLPLLRPAMVPAIMLGTIWTFNQFNVIFFITAGGPRGQTNLLITQAYILIQQEQLYGVAAAFSIIVFFVLFVLTLITNSITRATKAYDEA